MWWCCGKQGRDAPGCKYGKHECREDNEDEDGMGEGQEDGEKKGDKKNARCLCCKEKGHSANECKRDPNLLTSKDPENEVERIRKSKDFRKVRFPFRYALVAF